MKFILGSYSAVDISVTSAFLLKDFKKILYGHIERSLTLENTHDPIALTNFAISILNRVSKFLPEDKVEEANRIIDSILGIESFLEHSQYNAMIANVRDEIKGGVK